MNQPKQARGIYFLANNNVFEQTVAFLRSFRAHNPSIALCLIPYDHAFDQIAALRDAYSFSIFDDATLLANCDSISEKFHGFVLGTYRKLVAWEGIFDSFIYIDVDTVVIDSVDFAFEALKYSSYVASHSNVENIRRWVWKDSVYTKHILTPPQISFSANTGFFASQHGLLPMKHCLAKVNTALELKDDMELGCMEQPFLNYLVVSSGYAYTSLLVLRSQGVSPEAPLEWWAGQPDGRVDGGKLYAPCGTPIFLVHWAGFSRSYKDLGNELPYKSLWNFYRRSDIQPTVLELG